MKKARETDCLRACLIRVQGGIALVVRSLEELQEGLAAALGEQPGQPREEQRPMPSPRMEDDTPWTAW